MGSRVGRGSCEVGWEAMGRLWTCDLDSMLAE